MTMCLEFIFEPVFKNEFLMSHLQKSELISLYNLHISATVHSKTSVKRCAQLGMFQYSKFF